MKRHCCAVLALSLLFLAAAIPVAAQEQTGAIEGTIKDMSGAVVPGVMVEATSSGIGSVVTTTDASGNYRLPRVPPGVYSLKANLMGYKTAKVNYVNVSLGKTVTANMTMELAAVAQEITVTAQAPMVDVTQSSTTTSLGSAQIEALPKGRDFTSVVVMAAGAQREPFLQGLSIDGASGSENRFVLDGIDTTHPYNGVNGQQFSGTANGGIGGQGIVTDFIEEIQVKSAGYAAEFGGSVGGVVNVITKSGTNDFTGAAVGYFGDSSWNGSSRPTFYESSPTLYRTFPKDKSKSFEPGLMIGGPIVRDKLWFFGGYNPTIQNVTRTPVGATQSFDQDSRVDYYTGNVKGNIGSKFLFKLGGSVTRSKTEGVLPAQDNTTPAGTNLGITTKNPTTSYSLYSDYLPSSNLYFSGRAGKYSWDTNTAGVNDLARIIFSSSNVADPTKFPNGLPASDPRVRPAGFASLPPGSFQQVAFDKWDRNAGGVDVNLFADGFGHHSIKTGVQVETIKNKVSSGEFGNLYTFRWGLTDPRSLGVQGAYGSLGVRRFRTEGGADSNNMGVYLQDSWTLFPSFTLNLGVRAEKENVPYYGHTVDPTLPKWIAQWSFGDKVAPRIGFAWDALSNQRLKIYGSYGKYYDIMKIDMSRQSGGAAKWIDYWYPLDTLDWASIPSKCQISNNDQSVNPCPTLGPNKSINLREPTDPRQGVDPNLRPMSQREYQLGADFQVNPVSVFGVRFVNKHLLDTIEDVGTIIVLPNGNLSEQYFTANPGKGIVARPAEGCPSCPPQPEAQRDYKAVTFNYMRAFRTSWSGRVSYTYSRLRGNYSGLASSDEFGRNDPNVERYFDELHNSFDQNGKLVIGNLNTDRPHQVKAQITYRAPFGTNFGVNAMYLSGTPISEEVTYRGVPFFPHGRGNLGRTDALTQTDLLIAHTFQVARYGLEASLNVLNLFDQNAVTRVGNNHYREDMCNAKYLPGCKGGTAESLFFSHPFNTNQIMASAPVQPTYLKPLSFQGPRSVRLGLKVTF